MKIQVLQTMHPKSVFQFRRDGIDKFFDVAVFFLSRLVTISSFMSKSLLVLELRQFLFLPET